MDVGGDNAATARARRQTATCQAAVASVLQFDAEERRAEAADDQANVEKSAAVEEVVEEVASANLVSMRRGVHSLEAGRGRQQKSLMLR